MGTAYTKQRANTVGKRRTPNRGVVADPILDGNTQIEDGSLGHSSSVYVSTSLARLSCTGLSL